MQTEKGDIDRRQLACHSEGESIIPSMIWTSDHGSLNCLWLVNDFINEHEHASFLPREHRTCECQLRLNQHLAFINTYVERKIGRELKGNDDFIRLGSAV